MAQRAIRLRAEPPDTREVTSDGNSSGHCLGQSTLAILPISTPSWNGEGGGGARRSSSAVSCERINSVDTVQQRAEQYGAGQGGKGQERPGQNIAGQDTIGQDRTERDREKTGLNTTVSTRPLRHYT